MSPTSFQTAPPRGNMYVIDVCSGWGWIRTTEVTDNRFTVCPLWPLGNPSKKYLYKIKPMIGLEPITC